MSTESMAEYTIAQGRATSFYKRYERKEDLQHQTHFCPGCGHGTVHKMIANLDMVIAEHRRDRVAREANERFFASGAKIRDVYGKLTD